MINKSINFRGFDSSLMLGNVGIEKESLRISDLKLSKTPHSQVMGSALFNKYITTDFSDAQMEFITPPFDKNTYVISFLENLHHFVSKKINGDILWPLSMPPSNVNESEIPIARYGKSNHGLLKEVYRHGLSNRYGKLMQTISGVHFNYSLPEELWEKNIFFPSEKKSTFLKNQVYMGTIRNFHRYNWLLIYLFGCSPIISKYFLTKSYDFENSNKKDYFLPFATSLRMSDIGYQNDNQSRLDVSFNSIEGYIRDLRSATEQPNRALKKIPLTSGGMFNQLNKNHLQIEDEYYAIARPKSNAIKHSRQIHKIQNTGINYIELRSIDLNPFNPIGIDEGTLNFLEIFSLYCTLKDSKNISSDEFNICKSNDKQVAIEGRKPGLKLINNGKKVPLSIWALEIIEEMQTLADNYEDRANDFHTSIVKMKERVIESHKTPSSRLLELVLQRNITMDQLGYELGSKYLEDYISIRNNSNQLWEELETEIMNSTLLQTKEDKKPQKQFKDYLHEYFSN